MVNDTGLSFYEPWEANQRPDLFLPEEYPNQPTWQRLLVEEAYYIALNVPVHYPRKIIHLSRYRISALNPDTRIPTGLSVLAHLVDRGPSAKGRLVDASKALMRAIGLDPDDDTDRHVEVAETTYFDIPFGIYEKKA